MLKRKSIKKKQKSEEELLELKEKLANQWNLFIKVWDSRDRKCYETGKTLGNIPKTTMFHHVLEKNKYPEYELEEWNIVLLHPEVHMQVHANINKTPRVLKLRDKLIKEHEEKKN